MVDHEELIPHHRTKEALLQALACVSPLRQRHSGQIPFMWSLAPFNEVIPHATRPLGPACFLVDDALTVTPGDATGNRRPATPTRALPAVGVQAPNPALGSAVLVLAVAVRGKTRMWSGSLAVFVASASMT